MTAIVSSRKAATHFDPHLMRAGWLTKVVLTVLCFLWIIPVIGTFITSFRTVDDARDSGWWTVFTRPTNVGRLTLDNYDKAINGDVNMANAFINSLAISLPATFIPILIAAVAAYAFTFMTFKGREFLFLLIVSLLVVPNYVAFVPIRTFYAAHGWNGKFPAVWMAHVGFGMSLSIYVLRNYMSTLPKSVIESAKIDGASHLQTFYRLVLPMSTPAVASFAIFQFLWVWNDYMVALLFLKPGDKEPVTVATTHFRNQLGQGWEVVTAAGFFSMLLPIAVFLALQRYFVRGLTAGAVKG